MDKNLRLKILDIIKFGEFYDIHIFQELHKFVRWKTSWRWIEEDQNISEY